MVIKRSSIGMAGSGPKWPLYPDVIWQHFTVKSDESLLHERNLATPY